MRLTGDYNEWAVSQTTLGKILEVSQPRINHLIDEEIVIRDESSKVGAVLLVSSLKNYYLSKQSQKDSGNSVNFWRERGLHEKAKREMAELKLAKARGELYEAEIVEQVMAEQLTNFRNNLLGLPAKLALQLEGKNRGEINDIMTQELEVLLEELSQSYKNANLEIETDEESE